MKRISTLIALAVAGTVVPSQFVSAADPEVPSVIEVVVRVDTAPAEPTVSATAFDQLLADNSAWVVEPLIESRGVYLLARSVLVKEDKFVEETEKEAEDWAKKIEKDDLVLWSEPEREVTVEDRRFHAWPNSGHEDAIEEDLADQHAFAGLSLGTVHQVATGAGTVVAVLDTGVDAAHPMLAGRLLPGYDLIDDDPDPLDVANGVDDDGDGLVDEAYGHGTFVAGVVAQIAPDAAILPVRVLDADGRAELHTVIEGIDLAIEQGANVINMSFGLLGDHEPRPLKEALKRAKHADVVVVGAAGNDGTDKRAYPASESSVVGVGALDVDAPDDVAGFSCHGKWVKVAAPGVDVVSALPGGRYARWAGTSIATPVVAGQVALLVEVDPTARENDVRKALDKSARKMVGKSRADRGAIDILLSLDEIV